MEEAFASARYSVINMRIVEKYAPLASRGTGAAMLKAAVARIAVAVNCMLFPYLT